MHIELFAKTEPNTNLLGSLFMNTNDMLGKIASQSRNRKPINDSNLFKKTVAWGHESIQEFIDYIFWVEGISADLLKQLTRHRIASYNVMSGRHVQPDKCVIHEGIEHIETTVYLTNGDVVKTYGDVDGFEIDYLVYNGTGMLDGDLKKDCPIPLAHVRSGFPQAVCYNLFMKFNGRSLRNLLKLRLSEHAQGEIREMANKVYEIVLKDCPELLAGIIPS